MNGLFKQVESTMPEQVDPPELHQRLQSCNLSLFGGDNDCVWATIAHLLNTTVAELKIKTGLSPTTGISGIHENAVRGLLTSLGMEFWASNVNGLASKTKHSSSTWNTEETDVGFFEDDVSKMFPKLRQGLGVCYMRAAKAGAVATGHCVAYEPTWSAHTGTYNPDSRHRFRPSYDERTKGPVFRFVDYSGSPASDALSDVKESEIKFVFYICGSRSGARTVESEMQKVKMEDRLRKKQKQLDDSRKQLRDEVLRKRRGIGETREDEEL